MAVTTCCRCGSYELCTSFASVAANSSIAWMSVSIEPKLSIHDGGSSYLGIAQALPRECESSARVVCHRLLLLPLPWAMDNRNSTETRRCLVGLARGAPGRPDRGRAGT